MLRYGLVFGACAGRLAACDGEATDPAVPADYVTAAPPSAGFLSQPANLQAGRELFDAHCATCHGRTGRGDGQAGRAGELKPANLADPNGVAQQPLSFWFWRVSEGGTAEPFQSQGSVMPAWKHHLGEAERWQVIVIALSLSQPAP